MIRLLIALALLLLLFLTHDSKGAEQPDCHGTFTVATYKQVAKKAWYPGRWRDPTPVRKNERRTLNTLRRCSGNPSKLKAIYGKQRREFRTHRAYRLVAPFPGLRGEGYWLRWLAVPSYIVRCETNGYHGNGRWRAANGSGAVGPYQLLGHGAPFPARTARQRLANHRIAHDLYTNYGASQWACA